MLNSVVLIGRLAADPELKYTPSGVAVASLRLAVDRPRGKDGEERETDFFDVTAWRQQAEFASGYLSKGRLVAVQGRLQVRSWETPEGQKRRAVDVQAEQVVALDKPPAKPEE